MQVLVVDNYDSFVFNLVQYLGQLGVNAAVWRNDDARLAGLKRQARHHRWGPIQIPGWHLLDLFAQGAGRPAKVVEGHTQPGHGHMEQGDGNRVSNPVA